MCQYARWTTGKEPMMASTDSRKRSISPARSLLIKGAEGEGGVIRSSGATKSSERWPTIQERPLDGPVSVV